MGRTVGHHSRADRGHRKAEKARFERLLQDDAATQKQVDDLAAHRIAAKAIQGLLQSSLAITTRSLSSEVAPIAAQVDQVNDQIRKSIVNPLTERCWYKHAQGDEVIYRERHCTRSRPVVHQRCALYISGQPTSHPKVGPEGDGDGGRPWGPHQKI